MTLGAGGVTSNSNATILLSAKIVVGAMQTWSNNSSAQPLTFSGVISGSAPLILQGTGVTSPAALGVQGSGTVAPTPVPLTGAFVFSGVNTYSGAITLLNNGASLTLNGAGSLSSASRITLGGGSTLTLDSTASSAGRLGSVPITSNGGTLTVIGNAAGGTTDGIASLTLGSGDTVVNARGAGTVFSINGLTRGSGSSVAFNPTGGAVITAPGVSNGAGTILGGYAVYGTASGGTYIANDTTSINWATISGGQIVALASYGNSLAAGVDAQVVNNTLSVASATTHVNSLYLAGTGAASGTANIGFAANGNLLIVDSGGIISSGGTGSYGFNGHAYNLINATVIGQTNGSAGGAAVTPVGNITSGTSDLSIFTANGSNLRLGSIVTNNGSQSVGLTKSGNGTLDLSDGNNQTKTPNTYTGPTTINGGTITIALNTQLGPVPSSFVENQLVLNGGTLLTTSSLTGDANRGVTVGPQGGTLAYAGGSGWALQNQIAGPGGVAFAAISDTGLDAILLQPASGTAYTYHGPTTIESANRSYVVLGMANLFPSTTALTVTHGDAPVASPTTSPANATTAFDFTLNGNNLTVGSLSGEGNISTDTNSTAVPVLTVGTNNLSTTYSGILGGVGAALARAGTVTVASTESASLSLVKTGSGILTLSNSNTYTGVTSIVGGTLLVGSGTAVNATGSSLANTAVTVGDGTNSGALGGNGTINGAVTITSTGHLAPAMTGATFNTLTINNNLTMNGGALDFNFGAAPLSQGQLGSGDQALVTGQLSLGGVITINITQLANTNFGIGSYVLLDNSANGGAGFNLASGATFQFNGASNFNYAIVSNGGSLDASVGGGTVPLGDVYLEVLKGSPAYSWVGAVGAISNGSWNLAASNWTSSTAGSTYADGSNVTFDDHATGTTVVNVTNGGISPGAISFSNGLLSYTFNGGPIASSPNGTGITKSQSGSVTFNNAISTPSASFSGGPVTIGPTGSLHATGSVAVKGAAVLTVNGSLNTPSLTVAGDGALTVGAAGSINSDVALVANGTVVFNNVSSPTVASLTGSGSVTAAVAANPLTVTGTSQFDGALHGPGGLYVTLGATLIVTNGSSNYTGDTTVDAATLMVNNASGSATGSGVINIHPQGVLDGTGIIPNDILLASGGTLQGNGARFTGTVVQGGAISPGGAGAVAAITIGNLNGVAGSLNYDFAASGASDFIAVTGTATFSGNEAVNLNSLGSTLVVGTYPLLSAGALSTAGANFTVSNPNGPSALNYSILQGTGTQATQLLLSVFTTPTKWTGATSGSWDATSTNWQSFDNTPAAYSDGLAVTFGDNGANTNPITIVSTVRPYSLTFTNTAATTYTFSGADISDAPGGVILNGTGTVSFLTSNSYTGATVINGGTLVVGNDNALGAVPAKGVGAKNVTLNGGTLQFTAGNIATTPTMSATRGIFLGPNGGTISVNFVDTATGSHIGTEVGLGYSGVISGAGSLTVIGVAGANAPATTSILDLGAAATYTGNTTINNAVVEVNSAVGGPGTINNILPVTTVLNLINNGVFNMEAGASSQTVAGLIGDATGYVATCNSTNLVTMTVNPAAGQSYNFPGSVSGLAIAGKTTFSNASLAFAVGGPGTQVLSGANAYTGGTTITAGTLALAGAGTLGGVGCPLTMSGGTLDLGGTTQNVGNFTGSGGRVTNLNPSADSTLVIGNNDGAGGNFAGIVVDGPSRKMGLTKTGAGAIQLSGSNTYTGPTLVSQGTLVVMGSIASSVVTVAGGTLAGIGVSGMLGNVVLGNGTNQPGTAILEVGAPTGTGQMFVGNLTLNSDAAFQFVFNQTTPAGSMLTVTGGAPLALGSGLYPVSFTDLGSAGAGNFTIGSQFVIALDSAGISGFFAGAEQGATVNVGLNQFSIDYGMIAPNAITLTALPAIPEPGSLAALIGGAGMLAGLKRFRRRH